MTSKLHFLAHMWGYFHYFHYFRCILIVQNSCLSGKTLLLRREGLICGHSIAQMFYNANRVLGNSLITEKTLFSLLSALRHEPALPPFRFATGIYDLAKPK